MTTTLFDSPAAGWYPDPISPAHVRWWDGRAWTERQVARGVAEDTPPPPMPSPNPSEVLRPRREALAKEGWTADPTPGARTVEPSWLGFSSSLDAVGTLGGPTAWSTAGSWWLAFLPWIAAAIALVDRLLVATLWPFDVEWLHVAALALYVLIMLVAVISDRGQLVAWRHERAASGLWILLGPLVYLIARTISTHRNVRRGMAPLIVFLVNCVAVLAADYGVWVLLG